MGLEDNKARAHIELSKDPKTIEEAVQEVIAYIEATSYPKTEDTYYNDRNKRVRQVKRNTTEKPRQTDRQNREIKWSEASRECTSKTRVQKWDPSRLFIR